MKELYARLLKEWCDALVSLQITSIKARGIYGGIICPVCSVIHGRCGDAVYPLMHMAHTTGEKRYLDAAVKLQSWSDHVSLPDGSWVNEPWDHGWKGITVFGTIALGEALHHHSDLLRKDIRSQWMDRLRRAAEFLFGFLTMKVGLINYPIAGSLAMAVAGKVLGERRYSRRGRELAHASLEYFTEENKLIFGEGKPHTQRSPGGCLPIDLGYNVEESLPCLVLYGLIEGDEEVLGVVQESLKSHLHFMLPDGAWDNSWGTRNYKWTYWGSRTSDGCQPAYLLLADRHPAFAEVAFRNTKLLEACTQDGILYGGPHYHIHGELPCIHHTFCHAKAIASVLDYMQKRGQATFLPRNDLVEKSSLSPLSFSGIREFPEIATWLAAIGPWRGTVTAYDWEYIQQGHASGGTLTMLWHEVIGPVLCASMIEYSRPEMTNSQPHRDPICMALTPRLELITDSAAYRSTNDYAAHVDYEENDRKLVFTVHGTLKDKNQDTPSKGEVVYKMNYSFGVDAFEILAEVEGNAPQDTLNFFLPVISHNREEVARPSNRCIRVTKLAGRVEITSNKLLTIVGDKDNRIFNLVPGFEAIPITFQFQPDQKDPLKVIIKVH